MPPLSPKPGERLVLTPSVPAGRVGGELLIDEKAASGLALYAELWPGPVRCVFRDLAGGELAFGSRMDPATLPFEVEIIPAESEVPEGLIAGSAAVLGTADNHLDLPLAAQCRRLRVPLVYAIEYILETRLQIIDLDGGSLARRLRRKLWAVTTELKRRRAFQLVSAIQSNGTPAAAAYGHLVPSVLTYFDTRTRERMLASQEDMARRDARLKERQPLRLAFSGRLDPMKGVDHLVVVAARLASAGVRFQLDIFGSGSRETALREAVKAYGLDDRVRIHAPLPFETGLVPWMRETADLFLCCHPQSDPSCTYMETLACGVPIAGFANRAWSGILEQAPVGWAVRIGDDEALARRVIELDGNRDALIVGAVEALALAREHTFEATFKRRVDQLITIAGS